MGAALKLPVEAIARAAAPAIAPRAGSLLRFITCGSVDDGKSTLIGRILYEAGAVFEDHLEALDRDSRKFGTNGQDRDFALLVDGLAAEREQGITIDVAYRYFSTSCRHFIVADTPGHEQYTRNMATGASTADLAVLLVDARKGLLAQTRRHAFIVASMGVGDVVLAVNKMDLVDYDEAVFRAIEADFRAAADLGFTSITAVPVSAREGDNLTAPSPRMPWYRGPVLLPLLETIAVTPRGAAAPAFVLPVQWVNRPDANFRGFSGTIAAGQVSLGDAVEALPSRKATRVTRILAPGGERERAIAGEAVTLVLADEIDLSRGDVLSAPITARADARPRLRQEIEARLIITGERRVEVGGTFLVKVGTAIAVANVTAVHHAIDVETYRRLPSQSLALNGIGVVSLRFDRPLAVMDFVQNAGLGGFILIDRITNETSAFGFVLSENERAPAGMAESGKGARLLARFLGAPDSRERRERLAGLTWRLASALAIGLIVWIGAGNGALAVLAGAADLVLRPLARAGHDAIWRRIDERGQSTLSLDGGGI